MEKTARRNSNNDTSSAITPPRLSRPTSLTSNDNTSSGRSFVEITQEKLGAIITRPTLKPELLQRPPFRFLQDIVKEVQAATGCLGDTFQQDELNTKIEGAPAKAAFLEKLIAFVSKSSGLGLQINIKKVLAGQDSERTNELLQLLADIARQQHPSALKQNTAEVSSKTSSISASRSHQEKSNPENSQQRKELPVEQTRPARTELEEKILGKTDEERSAPKTIPLSNEFPNTKPKDKEPNHQRFELPSESKAEATANVSRAKVQQIVKDESKMELPDTTSNSSAMNTTDEKSFVEVTQQKLGSIITRPILKSELLQRPPFRFLQDIVKEVQAASGCFGDTFQQDELNAKIDGAPAKAAFLEKLVTFVSTESGMGFKINVKKILAGQDPGKTNELLQLLADIAKQHQSAQQRKNPEVVSKPAPETPLRSGQEQPQTENPVKELPKEMPVERRNAPETEYKDKTLERKSASTKSTPLSNHAPNSPLKTQEDKSRLLDASSDLKEETSLAGVAPPKVQEFVKTDSKLEFSDPSSTPSGIILEGDDIKEVDDDDDDDEELNANTRDNTINPGVVEDEKKHGRLVRDILKQQEKVASPSDAKEGQTSAVERSTGIKLGRIGGKERRSSCSQQMIDLLRENIQKVCQSVNPLGKCIDFVDEDLELMRLELEKWRQEQSVYKVKLEKEQNATTECLLPLQRDLQKIESQISEIRNRIQKLRGNIIRNDDQLRLCIERQIKN